MWSIKATLRLAATSDRACTQCHADLKTTHGATKLAANITGFNGSHPEFAALRAGAKDPGTIKFNHQVHLKQDLRGPNGTVQLKCAECHQLSADERSYMQPVNYEKHCASCHTLQFDRRFSESVPHKDPQGGLRFCAFETRRLHRRASGRDSVSRRARQALADASSAAAGPQCH